MVETHIRVAFVEPAAPLPANLTNQEVIDKISHAYPRLGGALGEAMRRFQVLTDTVNGVVPFEGFAPQKLNCPHCGSALIISEHEKETPHVD